MRIPKFSLVGYVRGTQPVPQRGEVSSTGLKFTARAFCARKRSYSELEALEAKSKAAKQGVKVRVVKCGACKFRHLVKA